MPHVGQEMLTLSGTLYFTPFGEFMISPIHDILNIAEFVSLIPDLEFYFIFPDFPCLWETCIFKNP